MKDGLIKVAAVTPEIRVADPLHNAKACADAAARAGLLGAQIIVLPELVLSAYTCGDLFLQPLLRKKVLEGLKFFAESTADTDALYWIGLPFAHQNRLYNCAAAVQRGQILGLVPKASIPNYSEFYEARHFSPAPEENSFVSLFGQQVPFGKKLLFPCRELPEAVIAAEICEDLWVPCSPSTALCMAGATVLCNLSASDENVGKSAYRRLLVTSHSARLVCGYVYADAGFGESSTDLVFSGHNLVAENGRILSEAKPFAAGLAISEIDCFRLCNERLRQNTYQSKVPEGFLSIPFSLPVVQQQLTRPVERTPFVPQDPGARTERCEEILSIQSRGLAKRLTHTGCKSVVLGLSGGLDSTLALLVCVRAFDLCKLNRDGILAVTMPGFGTTDRTYQNALTLAKELRATLKEISIVPAVRQHFADIGQNEATHDVTYENSQARERTQILMDLANQQNALVIGTGDLSELALGWATYNGDHMSMYGVNASIPKTLVRHLVAYEAEQTDNEAVSAALQDVLDTPVSPELLPAKDGKISQKTEELVGPYELHDFFLYAFLRAGDSPRKIYRFAVAAFANVYDKNTIKRWLVIFLRRFFAQQFKRSCLPDGPKVGSVALSPRGDWRMPSDASAAAWLEEAERIDTTE